MSQYAVLGQHKESRPLKGPPQSNEKHHAAVRGETNGFREIRWGQITNSSRHGSGDTGKSHVENVAPSRDAPACETTINNVTAGRSTK